MDLTIQKRLAAQVMKCSPSRITFDTERLADIKEAITKADIKGLINEGVIKRNPIQSISRFRQRKKKIQKRKGRQKGHGSRKGSSTARKPRKETWIHSIRNQRDLLNILRTKSLITPKIYRDLYYKSKGGFFRSRRHIRLYIEEHNLIQKSK